MKILILTVRPPFEKKTGDQIVAMKWIDLLSKEYEVFIVSILPFKNTKNLDIPKNYLSLNLPKSQIFFAGLRTLFSNIPIQAGIFFNKKKHAELENFISNHRIDLVMGFLIRTWPYLENLKNNTVIHFIDSMTLNFERRLNNASFFIKKLLKMEINRLKIYEKSASEGSILCLAVSLLDANYLSSSSNKIIDPLSIDLKEFYPPKNQPSEIKIVFSGNMDYEPNHSSLIWFFDEIFKKLILDFPDIELNIVGRNTANVPDYIKTHTNIELLDNVESMGDELRKMSISIAPMVSGSGMQFKILEAQACGLSVITNSIGLGDIKCEINEDIIVADTKKEFLSRLIQLIEDDELRKKISRNGLNYVRKFHSNADQSILKTFKETVELNFE